MWSDRTVGNVGLLGLGPYACSVDESGMWFETVLCMYISDMCTLGEIGFVLHVSSVGTAQSLMQRLIYIWFIDIRGSFRVLYC